MHASNSLLAAAMLLSPVLAVPNPTAVHFPRQTTNGLEPWITVDESGVPKTVTPVQTTISGTPTVISGAPNDLTGTVFTETSYGQVRTRTGSPPAATATGTDGEGAFKVCKNKDGANAPFCAPLPNANLYPGTTYYVLWDPTFFSGANTTVQITGDYRNATTGVIESQAFQSPKMPAAWGYFALSVDAAYLRYQSAQNISLSIAGLQPGAGSANITRGPTFLVTNPPVFHQEPTQPPSGKALYIGLPAVAGFVLIMLVGTCVWNRKARKIGLGNVMSRSRHGYAGGKSSRQRLGGLGKKRKAAERIQLMERELEADGRGAYRDEPSGGDFTSARVHGGNMGIPRRDSDALGSLAGTPTEDRRMELGRPGEEGRNVFRDELKRQKDGGRERF